jgi:uncharacterized protein YwgA
MEQISRKDLILLLLGIGGEDETSEGINGITRLQKFLFLLEREEGIKPDIDGFDFIPYKAGPYSGKVYDDLEFLENLGLITSEIVGEATESEAAEVDISFEELMGNDIETTEVGPADELRTSDVYEERMFRLTQEGENRVKRLIGEELYKPVVNSIRKIKSKFGKYSLNDLLYYIYTKHNDMATESEIKDKILHRGRRR